MTPKDPSHTPKSEYQDDRQNDHHNDHRNPANSNSKTQPKQAQGKLLDHNYDGIQELDNPLPSWWVALFYITILFGIGYFIFYTIGPGLTSYEKLEQQLAQEALAKNAQQASDSDSETRVVFRHTPEAIQNGNTLYQAKCASCHKADGGGLIGPNLTDAYWIHPNGSDETIYDIIKNGVVDKGMLAWESQLTPEQMADITVFIQSLKGSNPPNAKAPQGERY